MGAGTGGSAAAKRLSDPSANGEKNAPSVLVLEAGLNQLDNPNTINFKNGMISISSSTFIHSFHVTSPLIMISGFFLTEQPEYGFFYLGEGVSQLGGIRFDYPPARMWGGTSNINGALWVRG